MSMVKGMHVERDLSGASRGCGYRRDDAGVRLCRRGLGDAKLRFVFRGADLAIGESIVSFVNAGQSVYLID
jgi:hypothetical protein